MYINLYINIIPVSTSKRTTSKYFFLTARINIHIYIYISFTAYIHKYKYVYIYIYIFMNVHKFIHPFVHIPISTSKRTTSKYFFLTAMIKGEYIHIHIYIYHHTDLPMYNKVQQLSIELICIHIYMYLFQQVTERHRSISSSQRWSIYTFVYII
jgi:hypothetical protein